ncbi:MAG: 50S ribosomal protein L9 [Rickettsiaceae bacterium]|nr:50S ribosomal protein L9 [Rickettsiaceae bacterium]
MEIVLLKDCFNLGKFGDLVKVAPGYARNYLIPKKIAVAATAESKEYIASKKQELAELNANLKAQAQTILDHLMNYNLPAFIRQSADDNKLFGSVTKRDIAAVIAADFPSIAVENILLMNPIKNLGVYRVSILVHPELSKHELKVIIARSEEEAATLALSLANDAESNTLS